MEFIKRVGIFFLFPLVVLGAGGYFLYDKAMPHFWEDYPTQTAGDNYVRRDRLKEEVDAQELELQRARAQQAERRRNAVPPEKEIYQAQGLQFGPDASFAPLFESTVETARGSGIRIRSIATTDRPGADPVVASGLPGYNVSEIDIVAVGTYAEFQAFYKNVLREYYLTYFAEIEVKPWELDKSVLISNIKLRLYTKT